MRKTIEKIDRFLVAHTSWVAPLLIALLCAHMSLRALYAQTFATFGRDQGIFQYIAWALRNGDRAYRDIRDINGPLPHLWHMVMQLLGGEDEHVFRSIDTALVTMVYMFGAITIPRWVGLEVKRPALVAWSVAGIGVLGAQYVRYDWWDTAQREGLYSVLVLAALALQSIGHTTRVPRRALAAFALSGATTSLAWFGKPPCVVFALLQASVLVLDRERLVVSPRTALVRAAAGAAAVTLFMIGFVAVFGDLARCVAVLYDVPRLHHTIWNESLIHAYTMWGNRPKIDWSMATLAGFTVAFFVLKLPRTSLLAAVLPVGGAIVFAAQGKAFPYHMHMLTLGTAVAQLVILAGLMRAAQRRKGPLAYAVVFAAIALGTKSFEDARLSQGMKSDWAEIGRTRELRASTAYLERFPWDDFSAIDLREGAAFVAERTRADERVQMYGLDPYFLFLAKRKSATPVIYNFELNVDAALKGGSGSKPSSELKAWLRAHRNASERLVLDACESSPPAAFVLVDNSPFTHAENAETDFADHCPDLFRFMQSRYVPAARFGSVRIWLRKDIEARRHP
jgi:hypothetical protein